MLTGFVRNHTGIVLALPFIVASWLLPLLPFVAIAMVVTMVIGLEIFFIQVALCLQAAARDMLTFEAQKGTADHRTAPRKRVRRASTGER